jgi:hypothetical protein
MEMGFSGNLTNPFSIYFHRLPDQNHERRNLNQTNHLVMIIPVFCLNPVLSVFSSHPFALRNQLRKGQPAG